VTARATRARTVEVDPRGLGLGGAAAAVDDGAAAEGTRRWSGNGEAVATTSATERASRGLSSTRERTSFVTLER